MRKFMLKLFFPGSVEEYEEAKKLHYEELRVYRKRWHFILGFLLVLVPMLIILRSDASWLVKICSFLMTCGFIFTQDTISEHYALKIIRERKKK